MAFGFRQNNTMKEAFMVNKYSGNSIFFEEAAGSPPASFGRPKIATGSSSF